MNLETARKILEQDMQCKFDSENEKIFCPYFEQYKLEKSGILKITGTFTFEQLQAIAYWIEFRHHKNWWK